MARKRDYKAEYARRIRRGLAKGLARSQARGHARAAEPTVRKLTPKPGEEKKVERAVKALRSGKSQKTAAKVGGISVERLRRFIYENKIAKRDGSRWVMTDDRPRRVPTIHKGRARTITVPGFAGASLAGKYHSAVGHFVRSNDHSVIEPFEGEGLTDTKGRFFEFETDPNALHRYAAMDRATTMKLIGRVCFCLSLVLACCTEAAEYSEIQAVNELVSGKRPPPAWVADVEAAFNKGAVENNESTAESQQSDKRLEVIIQYADDSASRPQIERAQGSTGRERQMADIERRLEDSGVDVIKSIPESNAIRARIARSNIEQLASDPSVKAVHTERLFRSQDTQGPIERPSLFFTAGYINADEVWKRGYTGTGETIVILDNGIYSNHVVFGGGKIVQQACFSSPNSESGDTSLCPNGAPSQIGGNAASGNCSAHPKACAHGTHVASIAAGNDPSQFFAYDGIAYNANIISVQVFKIVTNKASCPDGPCLLASNFDIFEALNWVKSIAANYKIAAVNMSLGGGEYNSYCPQSLLDDPINGLRDIGILSTISSGNDGLVGAVANPACVEAALTVSATVFTLPVSWGNNAPMVDLLAPGTSIYAAGTPPSNFISRDGTSMSAPEVAGAVALLRSANPNATADQIAYALRTGGKKQKSFSWKWETTLLDVEASLNKLGEEAPPRGTQVLSIVSSSNVSRTDSYLRFFNSEFFTDTVRVAFVDDLTGRVVGRYSVDVPGEASIQKYIGVMEQAAGINTTGKSTYTAVVDSDFDGFVQHVIYNPVGAALTNVTSCVGGLASDNHTLINIHTSRIPPDYPSYIFVHNAGDQDAKAEFRIYEAGSGRSLGRATTPTIPKGTTISYGADSFYSAIAYSPRENETHTNFELQDGFDGTIIHIVNNTKAGVLTNMTDKCGIN